MLSSRILYSSDINLKEIEELFMRKIQESSTTTLQNAQNNINCLGQSKRTPADQNTPSGALQREVVCLSGIVEEIPEAVIDAESDKAAAGRFGITLFSLCLLNNCSSTSTVVKIQAKLKLLLQHSCSVFFSVAHLITSPFAEMNCCRS